MERDAMREDGAHVFDAETIDQELAELEHARRQGLDLPGQAGVARQLGQTRVLVTNHRHARGRRADYDLSASERVHEPARQRDRLGLVAAVGVQLAAARLLGRKFDLVAESLEYLDDRPTGRGKQGVVETGDEEREPHDRQDARLTGVRGSAAAVDVQDVSGALPRASLGGEMQHGLGDVLREHAYLKRRSLTVVLVELFRSDSVGRGALAAPARVPDPRALEDGIRVDRVDPDAA